MTNARRSSVFMFMVAAFAAILTLDISFQSNVVIALLYILPILATLWLGNVKLIWGAAIVASILTLIGFGSTGQNGVWWVTWAHLSLILLALWWVAFLSWDLVRQKQRPDLAPAENTDDFKVSQRIKTLIYVAVAAVCGLILFLDSAIPLGVAMGVLYLVPIFMINWAKSPHGVLTVGVAASILILIGYALSPMASDEWVVQSNRALSIFTVLTAAILLHMGLHKRAQSAHGIRLEEGLIYGTGKVSGILGVNSKKLWLAAGLLIVGLVSVFFLQIAARMANDRIIQEQKLHSSLKHLILSLNQTVHNQNIYVLTGAPIYAGSYRTAAKETSATILLVRSMAGSDPDIATDIDRIAESSVQVLADMEHMGAVYAADDRQAAIAIMKGDSSLISAEQNIEQVISLGAIATATERAHITRLWQLTLLVETIIWLLVVLIGVNVLKRIQHNAILRQLNDDKLHDINASLEWEISVRTKELQREKRFVDTILNTSVDCTIVIDATGIVQFVSGEGLSMFGYYEEEILGQNVSMLMGANDRDDHDGHIKRYLETREGHIIGNAPREVVGVTKDGYEIDLELAVGEAVGQDGPIFIGSLRDISERKKAEKVIQDSQQNYRLLLDSTGDAIYGIDMEGVCTFVNSNFLEVLGYQEESEVLGQYMPGLIHHSGPNGTANDLEGYQIFKALKEKKESYADDALFWRADGSSIPVEYWSHHIMRDGQPVGILVTFWDLTDQRATEQQLHKAQKMDALGQLTSGVAHDLNNIFQVVMGNIQLLQRRCKDQPETSETLGRILRASERAVDLIKRLLAFSSSKKLDAQCLIMNDHLGELENLMRRTVREDIQLEFRLADQLWKCRSDPAQFEAAILNLCVNARDAMLNGGAIVVETANVVINSDVVSDETAVGGDTIIPSGNYAVVTVSDTGTGIPADILSNVLEPFYTTKDKDKGTGLGLSMVYRYIKQVEGYMTIHSEVGVGTEMKLYFPQCLSNEETSSSPEQLPEIDNYQGDATVLVVEDDDDTRGTIISLLTEHGFNVKSAVDGPTAIEEAKLCPDLDLLLTDIVLPGDVGGVNLADQIKNDCPGLKVLFMSGYSESVVDSDRPLMETEIFISKPFTKSTLIASVVKALAE